MVRTGNCTHAANCTLHPPAWGHQEHFFPIPSLFVKEECGKKTWKWKRLNKGSSWVLVREKSFNPITESPLPTFISDKLNVSGQIIYFLYWKLTPIKNLSQNWEIQKKIFMNHSLTSYSLSISCYSTLDKMVFWSSFWNWVLLKPIFFFNNLTCRQILIWIKSIFICSCYQSFVGKEDDIVWIYQTFSEKVVTNIFGFQNFFQKLWSFSFQIWYSAYHQVDI